MPLRPDTFDHPAAAAWNWNLGDLFRATITYLDRAVGHPIEYCRIVTTGQEHRHETRFGEHGMPHIVSENRHPGRETLGGGSGNGSVDEEHRHLEVHAHGPAVGVVRLPNALAQRTRWTCHLSL